MPVAIVAEKLVELPSTVGLELCAVRSVICCCPCTVRNMAPGAPHLPSMFCPSTTSRYLPGAQPFVDHWDSTHTIKRSEGLMVNGREWNEWRFYDRLGRLTERAEFRAGERHGHVVFFYDNDSVQHDGWVRKGRQDSTMRSFYRNGKVMEEGRYAKGCLLYTSRCV